MEKRGYKQKYRTQWESDRALKVWIRPCVGNEMKARCFYCKCNVIAKYTGLMRHAATQKHIDAVSPFSDARHIEPTLSVKATPKVVDHNKKSQAHEKVKRKRYNIQKLSEEKVEELINEVKLKPGLYEEKSNLYQRQDWRNKAWEAIADELHEDESVCKSAWRSLREQFNKTVKDIKRSCTKEEADEYRLKYKYFENLLFLDDTIDPMGVPCKVDNKAKEKEITQINLENNFHEEFWAENASPKRSPHFWENESEEEVSFSSVRAPLSTAITKQKKTQDRDDDPFRGFPTQSMSQIEKNDVDGVQHFFLSISSIVKNYNLSVSDLALLQCKIMNFTTTELNKLKYKNTN